VIGFEPMARAVKRIYVAASLNPAAQRRRRFPAIRIDCTGLLGRWPIAHDYFAFGLKDPEPSL